MRAFIPCLVILMCVTACGGDGEPAAKAPPPADSQQWESAYVQSNGIRIHYWRTGVAGQPVIIMAHGITDYGLNWTSLAERIEADYDIIMYDARGHGYSDKPDGPYDVDTHVEDLAGLVRALGIEKPILMGHSMGGGTVALAAAKYPEMPRAVILEDPAGLLMASRGPRASGPPPRDFVEKWKKGIEADKAMGKEKLMELARTKRHPGWPDVEYARWAESKMLVSPNVVKMMQGSGYGDVRETYAKITAPALILKADADEEERQKHLEIASALPHGKLVHIDGAGHLIRLDRPEETEREIRAFLAAVP